MVLQVVNDGSIKGSSAFVVHDDSGHEGSASRGVAGGIAPLDDSGNVEDANAQDVGGSPFETGSYTGDGVTNRAITHNLGVIPKIVIITGVDYFGSKLVQAICINGTDWYYLDETGARTMITNTVWTNTYFYVGDASDLMNEDVGGIEPWTYSWVAWG